MAVNIFDLIGGIKDLEEDLTGDPNGYIGKNSRAICDAYQTDPNHPNFSGPGASALRNSLDMMCKPYYDELGEPPVDPESPFEGGQCPGVLYSVTVEFKTFSSVQTCSQLDRSVVVQAVGPVQGTRLAGVVEVTQCGFSAGDILYLKSNDSEFPIFVGGQSFPIDGSATIASIVRVDGLPDDCGDPEPVFRPNPAYPVPRPWGSPTIPGSDPNGDPHTYTPRRDPATGTPWIEIDGPLGPIGLPPFGGDPPDMSDPPSPPTEGPPIDVSGAGDVAANPDDEEALGSLLGYSVVVRHGPSGFQSVIPGSDPVIYSRVVGSIQLKFRGGDGVFYSGNSRITSQQCSILKKSHALQVVGCSFTCLPELAGLTLKELRGKDNGS